VLWCWGLQAHVYWQHFSDWSHPSLQRWGAQCGGGCLQTGLLCSAWWLLIHLHVALHHETCCRSCGCCHMPLEERKDIFKTIQITESKPGVCLVVALDCEVGYGMKKGGRIWNNDAHMKEPEADHVKNSLDGDISFDWVRSVKGKDLTPLSHPGSWSFWGYPVGGEAALKWGSAL